LYGFLEGDTLGLLILCDPDESIAALAEKLRQSASVRIAPKTGGHVFHEGRQLDPASTVRREGLKPLDRFDVAEGP
jgi:hypothetical protein